MSSSRILQQWQGQHFSGKLAGMRLRDGRYECVVCGARIDVRKGAKPVVVLIRESGHPNRRAIMVDGEEVHRCEVKRIQ